MNRISIKRDPKVDPKFESYPREVKSKLLALRKLIIATANSYDHIKQIEETLKWGEPSYLVKKGSTIRMDWKEKNPDQYALYFKCTSKLVPTFKEVFGDKFIYENNRAILFNLKDKIPASELKLCIGLALNYHRVKHQPLLGLKKEYY